MRSVDGGVTRSWKVATWPPGLAAVIVRSPPQDVPVSATAIVYVPTEPIVNSTSEGSPPTLDTETGEPSASDTIQFQSKRGETAPVTSPRTRITDDGPAGSPSNDAGEMGRTLTWQAGGPPPAPPAPVDPPAPVEPAAPVLRGAAEP